MQDTFTCGGFATENQILEGLHKLLTEYWQCPHLEIPEEAKIPCGYTMNGEEKVVVAYFDRRNVNKAGLLVSFLRSHPWGAWSEQNKRFNNIHGLYNAVNNRQLNTPINVNADPKLPTLAAGEHVVFLPKLVNGTDAEKTLYNIVNGHFNVSLLIHCCRRHPRTLTCSR